MGDTFNDGDELVVVFAEASEDGVGEFAAHLDVTFAGECEVAGCGSGPGVTKQSAEDVGVRKSGRRAVSLKSSARPEAMRSECRVRNEHKARRGRSR